MDTGPGWDSSRCSASRYLETCRSCCLWLDWRLSRVKWNKRLWVQIISLVEVVGSVFTSGEVTLPQLPLSITTTATTSTTASYWYYCCYCYCSPEGRLRMSGQCHLPVWNLRAVLWFPLTSPIFLPSPLWKASSVCWHAWFLLLSCTRNFDLLT